MLEKSTISRFLEAKGMTELGPAPYEGGLGIWKTRMTEEETELSRLYSKANRILLLEACVTHKREKGNL